MIDELVQQLYTWPIWLGFLAGCLFITLLWARHEKARVKSEVKDLDDWLDTHQ